ncbi:MAG: hypothetical protein ACLPY1_22895 [Terracidiphilus sp.]
MGRKGSRILKKYLFWDFAEGDCLDGQLNPGAEMITVQGKKEIAG